MYPFHNDRVIGIDWNPVVNKSIFIRNYVGPHAHEDIAVADYTYTDANSIFVDSSTGSNTNAGTQAAPKLTLLAAMNACTATKTKVVVLNSALYAESLSAFDNEYCEGIVAATGQTPTYTTRTLGFTPSDSNTKWVSKAGNDSTGDGTHANPYLTIAKAATTVDGTHTAIGLIGNSTWTEAGITMTGDFKILFAELGSAATIIPLAFSASSGFTGTETAFTAGAVSHCTIMQLTSGNLVVVYIDAADGGKIKAVTFTTAGVKVGDTTTIVSGSCVFATAAIRSDDSIVISYIIIETAQHKHYFTVIDGLDYGEVVAPTYLSTRALPDAGDISNNAVGVFSDDSFVVVFSDRPALDVNSFYFTIYDHDGSTVLAGPTLIFYGSSHISDVRVLDNQNFVILWTGDQTYFAIYTSAGASVKTYTSAGGGDGPKRYKGICEFDDGSFALVFQDGSNIAFSIWSGTGTSLVTETTLSDIDGLYMSAHTIDADRVMVIFDDGANSCYSIFNKSGAILVDQKIYWAGRAYFGDTILDDADGVISVYWGADTTGRIRTSARAFAAGITVSVESIINGIHLATGGTAIEKMLSCSDKITAKYTTIDDSHSAETSRVIDCHGIYSTDEIDVENCSIHDNDIGIYVAANKALVKDSEVYRNTLGYGIHIKGTAATSGDITVNHCTIFNNQSGLRLEDNHGTREIVKNCIIQENDVYGIYAETAMTYTNSINTNSTNYNATAGASVIVANALFIDPGDLLPANTNLQLKMRIIGYFADSPAYQLADDSSPDRDAGAWDAVIIGEATSWSSANIIKPVNGIDVSYAPVGEKQLVKKDGSIETTYDAWREIVGLDFDGVLNADFAYLLSILTCGKNTIRLRPDPITYPSNIDTYTIVYKEINGSAKNYRLSRTGKQNVKLSVSRPYVP